MGPRGMAHLNLIRRRWIDCCRVTTYGCPRLGADWIAVIVAAVLVLLAVVGLLPSIPFLVK